MNVFLEYFVSQNFPKAGKALDLGAGKFFDVACLKQLGKIFLQSAADSKTASRALDTSTFLSVDHRNNFCYYISRKWHL